MFSLYVIISHNKLLKKSDSIKEKDIMNTICPIINKRGGVLSDFSNYFSLFPSNYEYSKHNLIICLQEIHEKLLENRDLIGFSIIVDCFEPQSEFEYSEIKNQLFLKTTDVDKIWFTQESYKLVSHIFKNKLNKPLVMVPKTFFNIKFNDNQIDLSIIDSNLQSIFNNTKDSIAYFNADMNISLYKNITYWAEKNGYEKVLYIDFGFSCDKILTFIDFIISFKCVFDPCKDLTSDELKNWGLYLELYKKFSIRSYDCFILDDAVIHFNKLILLWVESFTSRFNTLFIIKYNEDRNNIEELWSIISILNNIKLFIFKSEYQEYPFQKSLPKLFSLEDMLDNNIDMYLDKKDDNSLMILYISLITAGAISTSDLLNIFKGLGFNILTLREELDNYRRLGFLLGDNNLYPGSNDILPRIIKIRKNIISNWKNSFLKAFLNEGYQNNFSYSYIFSILALDSDYRRDALEIFFQFIQKILDLGRNISLSLDFVDKSFEDPSLKNILQYKKVRESRIKNIIDKVEQNGEPFDRLLFNIPLESLDLLNIWSLNQNNNLIDRCKSLYFRYQTNGEKFNESRIKILFSLGLLSKGSIGEAVDYFDLNCSFSKNISDTYSFIRNGCFYCATLFIKGDISGVLRVSKSLLENNWIYFKTRWMLYLKFIRIRALIELRYYNEALETLEKGLVLAKNFSYLDIISVYTNWKGRVLYYLDREGDAREVLLSNKLNNESYYFLSEIEYYSGNNSRALYYINKVSLDNDDKILFDENLKWRDGFFVIEEFFNRSNRSSVLFQEIRNFKLMLNILDKDNKSLLEYFEIINSISNNSIGIHEYRYIFYLYSATKDIDVHDNFNRDNLLNKVTRLLQQRASNIADHSQKHHYLDNFYNRPIIEISRSKKLF